MAKSKVTNDQNQRIIGALETPGEDAVGDLLRRIGYGQPLLEAAADAIAGQKQKVAGEQRNDAGLERRQVVTDDPAAPAHAFRVGGEFWSGAGARGFARSSAHPDQM